MNAQKIVAIRLFINMQMIKLIQYNVFKNAQIINSNKNIIVFKNVIKNIIKLINLPIYVKHHAYFIKTMIVKNIAQNNVHNNKNIQKPY